MNEIPGYQYALIKIFRYGRMYEIDAWIGEYLQYKSVTKTVFEIKQMERSFDILKFILSICSNLHIMSCT